MSPQEHESAAPPADPPIRASILLVDDHPANLVALEAILESLGHRLVKAGSGDEALQHLLEEEFALILMDVQMPGLDGLETAQLVKQRQRSRHIPIIFLTAISREMAYIFKGYQTGAVDYLLKPIDPEILRAKVAVFVDLYIKSETMKRQESALRERERRLLERQSEERYHALIDSIPHGVLAATAQGLVTHCNRFWCEYTGLTCAESAGARFLEAVSSDERAHVEAAWGEAIRRAEPFEIQLRLRRRDGTSRWHLARAVPERGPGGAITGWIATVTDVHERLEAVSALHRAMEVKDTFVAAASHELRTPLTSAKLQTQLAMRALEQDPMPALEKPLRTIARQVDRMIKLVESMLDLSRIESGKLSLDFAPFDVSELLREVCDLMQSSSQNHEIHLRAPDALPVVGDRNRLEQVVTNLLTNAIRYSPEGGPIELIADAEGDVVHMALSDRGLGIPPEKQALIFEPFGQAHGGNYGGLGLGLTVAKTIVERHGGTIGVESHGDAAGTTFHVRLPRKPREPAQRRAHPGAARDAKQGERA